MIKRVLLAAAASVLTLGWVGTAPAAYATTYTACDGVWVVVDYGALGGKVETSCATSYATGTAALRSAGFNPTLSDGFVDKIAGKPSKPDSQKAYWSYWHATRKSDGSYGNWSYSNAGSNAYHPTKGDAEGWHYISLSDPASGPDATPAKNPAATVAATPTPTRTKSASAKPTKKATASASASASATTKATVAAASSSPSSTPTESTSATPDLDPSAEQTVAFSAASEVAAVSPTAETTAAATGNPTGTIAAGIVVAVAVGGLGSWWLVRGRRR